MLRRCLVLLLALGALLPMTAFADSGALDLTHASIYVPGGAPGPVVRAAELLADEIAHRTRVRLPILRQRASGTTIAVGVASALGVTLPAPANHAEGFRLSADSSTVTIAGHDPRGALFGVGKLLRTLLMERDRVSLPLPLELSTAPRYPLRGHQLGYRPKTNSYDAWDERQWEQYFRDLIVFGANAVELIPPRSDDAPDSPHFPLPQIEMLAKMSRIADSYGLDVWLWYPALDPDYTDPKAIDAAVAEWAEVFRATPRVDAVFVPGGDPGHTAPKPLMALLERQAGSLRKIHPKAQLWVSPQGFTAAWMDEFLNILNRDRPTWLTGIVFGPQVRMPLPELRRRVPSQYPIRHYPDITHSTICQYPVPDWDIAFALTSAREGINPRPLDQRRIFRATQTDAAVGFLTYSEGCNDDVNKAVWSALGWDPDADIAAVLREFGRYFIGDAVGDGFGQGLLALERNWQGPLLANAGVETTLQQFQAMEAAATPQQRANWRFQQALYRAYYDAYTRRRLIDETAREAAAVDALGGPDSMRAMDRAAEILSQVQTHPIAPELRQRIFALAEALFQSVRMQLSVAKYQAIAVDRGASLDTLDMPLNDRVWWLERFAAIRKLPSEAERLAAIQGLLHWRDPGPGGFYDDLGDPTHRPHLVGRHDLDTDPGTFHTPRTGFDRLWSKLSWSRYAETLYDTPLQVRYAGLDPSAKYRVRIAYAIQAEKRKIRLVAGDGIELHPPREKPVPTTVLEYDVPADAIVGGALALTWTNEPGLGSNGRGCQVCEIWLLRVPN